MSIIVIIKRPLPCCKTGAVVSVTSTVNRITCQERKKEKKKGKDHIRIALASYVFPGDEHEKED